MRKLVSLAIALAFILGVSMAMAVTAPTTLTIKANPKKPVEFPHKMHADKFKCTVCHHKLKADAEPQLCTNCHKKTDGEAPKYFKAFHSKTAEHSCLGCHKAKGGDKAPTKCAQCHPKK